MNTSAGSDSPWALPSYAELAARAEPSRPSGTSWGVFGDDDELGTINLLDRSKVLAGLRAAVSGEVISLNWRFDLPSPNPYRSTPERVQVGVGNRLGRDDYIERFPLQFSSQWDGLRHIQHDGRFYNGVSAEEIDDPTSSTLGIDRWADHGVVGRGVLLDVATFAIERGDSYDPSNTFEITPQLLDDTAAAQGIDLELGDVLLVRTGWCGWYETLDQAERDAVGELGAEAPQPGLSPGTEMAAWLWDRHVAAVACDNTSVEMCPISLDDFLHVRVIPSLGLAIGEHFWLDDLADACRREQRWTFLFTSAPLNVPGGVGSPPNALAIL